MHFSVITGSAGRTVEAMSRVIRSARIRGGEPQDIIMEAQAIVSIAPRGVSPPALGATTLHEAFRHQSLRRRAVLEGRVVAETRRATTLTLE